MKTRPNRQKGASAIATILLLAVLAYGVFIGMNYVPIMIESQGVDSILNSIRSDQQGDPITTEHQAEAKVIRMLQVNEMDDMAENLKVRYFSGKIVIKFSYDRKLDLGFKEHPMHYEKVLELEIQPQ